MPDDSNPWLDAGPVEDFAASEVREVTLGAKKLAITHRNGVFGAISNACNHAGGPLGQGRLDGDFVVCPWHNWKFHRVHGTGEPGFEADAVPCHEVRVQDGHLWVRAVARTQRNRLPHEPHPLARPVKREPGGIRVLGISTTAQDPKNPRYSTSQALLEVSLQQAKDVLGCETQLIKLSDLQFRACEGYYSKSARACTWPCSITQMDESDQLDVVYEALVHWADVGGKYPLPEHLMALLVLGMMVSLTYNVVAYPLYTNRRTKMMPLISGLGMASNILGNLWLIPAAGPVGAAWATLFSNSVMTSLGHWASRRQQGCNLLPGLSLVGLVMLVVVGWLLWGVLW